MMESSTKMTSIGFYVLLISMLVINYRPAASSCLDPGAECQSGSQCCSYGCGHTCICSHQGQGCRSNAACCKGYCTTGDDHDKDGVCTCKAPGQSCSVHKECCGSECMSSGVCGFRKEKGSLDAPSLTLLAMNVPTIAIVALELASMVIVNASVLEANAQLIASVAPREVTVLLDPAHALMLASSVKLTITAAMDIARDLTKLGLGSVSAFEQFAAFGQFEQII
ncbi:hypothetical protein DdX_19160 [Ditylenchus destructor]|uniref:Uncharacterized protein n=1 Tax=Ditylenchus destructor TaxID=166010 RepID=A0AAD4MKY2_9BILA|nr:hypothetical protein DdX_19160 [Ditylenchus destructor]